ncbi:probable cytochrome P450 304a1 [Colias croceus]|uniref:probable cytochrome P450 304a1 n=1 Tax=Colias crocea TaxID=72248 RepID=UPI001E27BFE6|nr:probable cytochrome P450 304a1 [Colias croceus]
MIGSLILLFIIAFLLKYSYSKAYERDENFPPGPIRLPIYGGYWIIATKVINNLGLATMKLAEEYNTKVVGLYLGKLPQILVNDPATIKEVLSREEFDGRLDTVLARARSYWKKLGIFFTDGYFWHVQRRYSLRYMRDSGFGRRDETLEAAIVHDTKNMIEMVMHGTKYPAEKNIVNGNLIYLPHFFAVPFINGLLHVFVRSTLPREKYADIWELARKALLFQRSSNDLGGAVVITPWLKDFFPKLCGYSDLTKGNGAIVKFFETLIKEVQQTHDESYDRHFIDSYLTKMKEEKRTSNRTTYSVEQLALICTDYMFPAASAVEMMLSLLVERMLLQPEIQEGIHEEIDRVVGRDRIPTLDDRAKLPYTEACIREMLRFETLVPLGVAHRAMVDTKLEGFDIPKDTSVSVNLLSLHTDKKIWGDPENFRPERYIVDGKLQVTSDKSLPFGAGRRLCAGETYARQGMFLVFAVFMQAFHVSTADGRPLKKPAKRIQGIITSIPEFWVRVTPRI